MTRRSFAGLTTLGVLGWPLAAAATNVAFSQVATEMRWAGVPGVSLATVTASAIRTAPFGLREVSAQLPVTAATMFEAASLSKPVFVYAVLELVRAGGLDLNRPLDAYLPEPYPIDDPRAKTITARHVLTHTSGLPNWRRDDRGPLKLHFTPGTQYLYSGEGFYFLQTVVEAITGKPMEQFMRPTLDTLGMRDSSFIWRDAYRTNCASPYDRDLRPLRHDTLLLGEQLTAMGRAVARPLETWNTAQALIALPRLHPSQAAVPHNAMPNAAWSLLTTARDYASFVRALLLQPEHMMFKPIVRRSDYVWRGLGIELQKDGAAMAFFHTGANPGFKAVMFGEFESKRGVVVFSNSDNGFALNMHVVENALGEQPAVLFLEQP